MDVERNSKAVPRKTEHFCRSTRKWVRETADQNWMALLGNVRSLALAMTEVGNYWRVLCENVARADMPEKYLSGGWVENRLVRHRWNSETSEDAVAYFKQERWYFTGGCNGDCKKWWVSELILRVEPAGFADRSNGLQVWEREESGSEDDSRLEGQSRHWWIWGRLWEKHCFWRKAQSSVSVTVS